MAMAVYLWHLSLLVIAFLTLFGLGIDPPVAGSGLWWLTRPFWLLGLALVLSMVATLLAPLERGRPAAATRTQSQPSGQRDKESRSQRTTNVILATIGSGMGATLASLGLLGYVASGLQPAPHGSSVLLFVPVDPIQNTVCALVGFALSTFAARWSRQPA
jgi:hypothetical protein